MAITELAVVGAGPAGLAAAIRAARAGVEITLVDEYSRPGGQYLKGTAHTDMSPAVSTTASSALVNSLVIVKDGF